MISTSELKKGLIIELDGNLYTILDYQHIKMGRGSAQVRIKLRDVRAGHIVERTFQAGEKFPSVELDRRTMQYLYQDNNLHYLMDTKSFEQITLDQELLGNATNYLKDGSTIEVFCYQDKPIGIELPIMVELKVRETGPGFKGDTATGGSKPAVLETGLVIQVPFFINTGDTLRIDTRIGEYIARVG